MGGSLLKKLAFYFAIFSMVPLLSFSIFSLYKFYENSKSQFDQRLNTLSQRLQSELNQKKKSSLDWLIRFKQDPRLPIYTQGGDGDEVISLLRNFGPPRQTRVRVFDAGGGYLTQFGGDGSFAGVQLPSRESSKHQVRELTHFQPSVGLILSAKSVILSRAKRSAGSLVMDTLITVNDLQKWTKELQANLLIVNEAGKPLYSAQGPFKLNNSKDFLKKKGQSQFQIVVDSGEGREIATLIPLSTASGGDPFFLGVSLPQSLVLNPVLEIMVVLVSVLALILLLVGIFSYSISRSLLSPFYYLVEQVHAFDGQRPIRSLMIKEPDVALLAGAFQKMADRIQRMRNELEQKVHELEVANRESQAAQDQLLQSTKMASLGQLVAGVAHELNNPISFIQGNIAPLREYCDSLVRLVGDLSKTADGAKALLNEADFEFIKKDLPKLLGSFDEGTKRTREIISGLRGFSRQDKAQYTEIQVNELIDKAIKFVEPQLKTRIKLERQFSKVPSIWCVDSQISQVFVNLLTNAIQAIRNDGRIWVNTSLEKKGFGPEGGVKISFQDSGSGIKDENLAKIFDPFFTTKDVGEGTGLGLSISYGIIRSHGGEIKVRSKLGVGTEFIILLPIKPPAMEANLRGPTPN